MLIAVSVIDWHPMLCLMSARPNHRMTQMELPGETGKQSFATSDKTIHTQYLTTFFSIGNGKIAPSFNRPA